jgi:hypothetical protein
MGRSNVDSIGTGGRHQSECPADIIGIRTRLIAGGITAFDYTYDMGDNWVSAR